jgi:hypothetical protein
MNDEARRIASQYDVSLIPGVDPLREGFDRARNVALDACGSDWCLSIDTDEKLVGARSIEKYLRENAYHAYALAQHHFACDVSLPPDTPCRIFRKRPHQGRALRFWGTIHEHPEFGINEGFGSSIALPDVHIAHVGYLSAGVRHARVARNWPLLELDRERYPERLLQKHFIMRDNMYLVQHALQQNGGRLDDEIRGRCRETIQVYQEHFLGKTTYVECDSLQYYSDALTILGEGFEAVYQVAADKLEAKANGARRYRFASAADFQAELKRAASGAERFESEWW